MSVLKILENKLRIKGLLALLFLAVLLFVMSVIFTDRWLERGLENLGATIAGAKVEIDHLDFSLIGLHIRWDSLQVADVNDTWKNIITTGDCEFNVALMPLLRKCVIIDKIQVTNIQSGTPRTSDGKLRRSKKAGRTQPGHFEKMIAQLENQVTASPAWDAAIAFKSLNIDSVLNVLEIYTPRKIDSLYQVFDSRYTMWDSTFNNLNLGQAYSGMRSQLESIRPNEIRTLTELTTTLATIDRIRDDADSLRNWVKTTKTELMKSLDESSQALKRVDDWIQEDYSRALTKAKLPDFSKHKLGQILFGARTVEQVRQILNVAERARNFSSRFQAGKPKKEKPPRLKGQTIHFPCGVVYPELWIKEIILSGKTKDKVGLEGRITHLVSNQKAIGQPTAFAIGGIRGDGAELTVDATFSYLSNIPKEVFSIKMTNAPVGHFKLADSKWLPQQIKRGKIGLFSALELSGDTLRSNIELEGQEMLFEFSTESRNPLERAFRTIISNTPTIDVHAKIFHQAGDLQFSLDSNLDDMFAGQLRALAGAEIDKAKSRVMREVDQRIEKPKSEINNFVAAQTQKFEKEIARYESELQTQIDSINAKKKQLQDRIEQEKNQAKRDLTNQLKKKIGIDQK